MNPIDFQKRAQIIQELNQKIENKEYKRNELKNEFINCNSFDIDLDIPIYKIISFKDLKRIFNKSSLSLSKPENWKDPQELFLFNIKGKLNDNNLISFDNLRNKIFCSCWTLNEECEGLWKTHGNSDAESVKFKSTPRKIMKYLYDINNKLHYESYFCGLINYVEVDNLSELITKDLKEIFSSMGSLYQIYSVFFKRKPFEYEKEIRFIFNAPSDITEDKKCLNKWDVTNKYYYFKIDINDVIEEIVFHPDITDEKQELIKNEIQKYNFPGKIYKSSLYEERNIVLPFN